MNVIADKIEGGCFIEVDTQLLGLISGDVTISNDANLRVNGLISGNVKIHTGSRLILHGTVTGDIQNHGSCEIFGKVSGSVFNNGGDLLIDEKSLIKGSVSK